MSKDSKLDMLSLFKAASRIDRVRIISGLSDCKYESIKDVLSEALHDKYYSVRSRAVSVLGEMGDDSVAQELLPLLKDPHYEVRYVVAEALGLFCMKDSIPGLIDALNDAEELVRLNAAQSLGIMKAVEAKQPLLERLNDSSELVRAYAAEALGEIGDDSVLPTLRCALKNEKRNAAKLRLLEALYLLGDKDAFSAIMKLLNVRAYRTRCATARILAQLADSGNVLEIIHALSIRRSKEESIAVNDAIDQSIDSLKKTYSCVLN